MEEAPQYAMIQPFREKREAENAKIAANPHEYTEKLGVFRKKAIELCNDDQSDPWELLFISVILEDKELEQMAKNRFILPRRSNSG
jgi:hypothetical protein